MIMIGFPFNKTSMLVRNQYPESFFEPIINKTICSIISRRNKDGNENGDDSKEEEEEKSEKNHCVHAVKHAMSDKPSGIYSTKLESIEDH